MSLKKKNKVKKRPPIMNKIHKMLVYNIKTYLCTLINISLRNILLNIFPGNKIEIETCYLKI